VQHKQRRRRTTPQIPSIAVAPPSSPGRSPRNQSTAQSEAGGNAEQLPPLPPKKVTSSASLRRYSHKVDPSAFDSLRARWLASSMQRQAQEGATAMPGEHRRDGDQASGDNPSAATFHLHFHLRLHLLRWRSQRERSRCHRYRMNRSSRRLRSRSSRRDLAPRQLRKQRSSASLCQRRLRLQGQQHANENENNKKEETHPHIQLFHHHPKVQRKDNLKTRGSGLRWILPSRRSATGSRCSCAVVWDRSRGQRTLRRSTATSQEREAASSVGQATSDSATEQASKL
jgi:hypothetical protein